MKWKMREKEKFNLEGPTATVRGPGGGGGGGGGGEDKTGQKRGGEGWGGGGNKRKFPFASSKHDMSTPHPNKCY